MNRLIAIVISLGALLVGSAASSSVDEIRQKVKVAAASSSESRAGTSTSAQVIDPVTEWNQHAINLTLLSASALAPVQQTRVMAIIHLSINDAVNGITRKYETYLSPGRAPANASPDAAAIAAAHYALRNLFTSQASSLDAMYLNSLAAHALSEKNPGIDYGRAAANALLTSRANDFSAQAQYAYNAARAGIPGVWVPLNNEPALLPGWGKVMPFVLHSASQFRPDGPPSLGSAQYADDYNEIKIVGALNSLTRTSEQTQIAQFWRAPPTAIWNPVLKQVIASRKFDLSAKARAFALLYLTAADASIACWEAKYTYNSWRPQLAIRGGNLDDNELTIADGNWQPLLPTPPHPEYPSGHASDSAAMATILELLFGDNPGVPIVVTLSGITREWDTFDEALHEVIDARVYSGIHFRSADEAGARMGRQIAHFASTHVLRPCQKAGRDRCS